LNLQIQKYIINEAEQGVTEAKAEPAGMSKVMLMLNLHLQVQSEENY
jgi:hypothetical protein